MIRRVSTVAAVIAATVGIGWLVQRDRLQQRRIDELSARVGEISDAVKALELPVRLFPALLGQQRCAIDPRDLERIRSSTPAATTTTTAANAAVVASPTPARRDLSTEQRSALYRARQQLDAAISRHSLTRDDVLEMRAQLANVGSPPDVEALRARIATAINHRELVPNDPLFIMP